MLLNFSIEDLYAQFIQNRELYQGRALCTREEPHPRKKFERTPFLHSRQRSSPILPRFYIKIPGSTRVLKSTRLTTPSNASVIHPLMPLVALHIGPSAPVCFLYRR